MNDLLTSLFGWICGQDPGHLWFPGNTALCCCQRCTGLYAGAVAGLLLHWVARPRLSGRFLAVHGWFFAAMVPLGFHWLPQGPLLRTASGYLFALTLVTYLSLVPRHGRRGQPEREPRPWLYALGAAAGFLMVLRLATSASPAALLALTLWVVAGVLGCGALVLANVLCGLAWLVRPLTSPGGLAGRATGS